MKFLSIGNGFYQDTSEQYLPALGIKMRKISMEHIL